MTFKTIDILNICLKRVFTDKTNLTKLLLQNHTIYLIRMSRFFFQINSMMQKILYQISGLPNFANKIRSSEAFIKIACFNVVHIDQRLWFCVQTSVEPILKTTPTSTSMLWFSIGLLDSHRMPEILLNDLKTTELLFVKILKVFRLLIIVGF